MIYPGADIAMVAFEWMLLEESHSANNFHRQINDTQGIIRREIFRRTNSPQPFFADKLFTIDPRFCRPSEYARVAASRVSASATANCTPGRYLIGRGSGNG